jgi:tRNA G18 (ribose-2'-O)-methylase SpoU
MVQSRATFETPAPSDAMPSVFLHSPRDFHNLCLMARTLEVFGHRECLVFDPGGLIRESYGKVRTRELRVVSAGAFEKVRWQRVHDPEAFLASHAGRVVATVLDPSALRLEEHRFDETDLVLFGSERSGLPDEVVARSDVRVTIPVLGETQSLNLAVTLGVVLFERQRQLRLGGG